MRKFLAVGCWLLMAGLGLAQEKDLVINAAHINYEQDQNIIEAMGSVEAVYKDFQVTGEHLIYYTDKKTIFLDGGFKFKYEDVTLSGKILDYKIKEREGRAESVRVKYQNVGLTGGALNFDAEKIDLLNASFTTCDLIHPHYHITGSEIILYPRNGWLVTYWGVFWVDSVPTVPVPVYIYDVEAQRKGRVNVLPYPAIGTNDEDGMYASENFAWNIKRELNGTINVNYAAKKGWGGGAEANYIYNDYNEGNVRFYGNPQDNFWGGLTHTYSFGEEIKARSSEPWSLVMPFYRQFELNTLLSYRERINYERVSQLPSLTFNVREGYIKNIKVSGSVSAALISEESSGTSLFAGSGMVDLSTPVYKNSIGTFTPGINLNETYYGNKTSWTRLSGRIRWDKDWRDNFLTFAGYSHYFSLIGTSPYRYELYRFQLWDTVNLGFLFSYNLSQFGAEAVYNLPALNPQDIDLLFKIGIHCYNIAVTYRALRNEFNLGVNLN